MHWNKLAILGVGLLGGSLGLASRERQLARVVSGLVRRRASLIECGALGVLDRVTLDPVEAVEDADLVVLCTPVGQMAPLLKRITASLKPGTVVTDVGSVKSVVARELESLVRKAGAHFVGSHPMAGSERIGVSGARADLFQGSVCVLTPTRCSDPTVVARLQRFWQRLGCRVLKLSPEKHDQLVGRSSHLPYLVAAQLASLVLDPRLPREQATLCASGFRDCTRVASGSPEMWRDIVVANRNHLDRALGRFTRELQVMRQRVRRGDAAALRNFFARAKLRRDAWLARATAGSIR